ncbi:MAG: ATP-binding protein [Planctomycetota bacterium]|nr:MAG: ATP-binding protein [Planctomycetota bacterium]
MKLLGQIQKGREPRPRRVMLYGTHGIGKSTFGSMSQKPIFLQTEDGLGEIDCEKFPIAETFDQVMATLSELYSEKHSYRTVVIDSLDWLERLIWADVCQKRMIESIEDIGYAKGYTFALTQWREFLEGLTALRNERGMMVILIAHAKIERFENPETESYDRYVPRLHKLASAVVQEWCDEVLFATYAEPRRNC